MDPSLREKLVQLGAFVCFLFPHLRSQPPRPLQHQPRPVTKNPGRPDRKYFVGMPIPAAAGVIAAVVHWLSGTPVP